MGFTAALKRFTDEVYHFYIGNKINTKAQTSFRYEEYWFLKKEKKVDYTKENPHFKLKNL